jgi:hypothetical protein
MICLKDLIPGTRLYFPRRKKTFMTLAEISPITEYLFVTSWPTKEDASQIISMGVRLILSMHWIRPSQDLGEPPLDLLWLPTFDNPLMPIPIGILRRGTTAAIPVIKEGGKVLVHCKYGIHRSVAMACCVLIGQGYSAEDAMQLIKEKREVADPDAWYIRRRIMKFWEYWSSEKAN